MATLKSKSNNRARQKFLNRSRLFVEGRSDKRIYHHFFRFGTAAYNWTIETPPNSDDNGGGSSKVISFLKEHGTAQDYGLLDRDTLLDLNQRDLLLETNDEQFFKAMPLRNNLYFLHRWELENYLLNPTCVHHEDAIILRADFDHDNGEERAAERLTHIGLCNIPIQAANIWIKEINKDLSRIQTDFNNIQIKPLNLLRTEFSHLSFQASDASIIQNLCIGYLRDQASIRKNIRTATEQDASLLESTMQSIANITEEKFKEKIEEIATFDHKEAVTYLDRWERISRIIEGKEVIKLFNKKLEPDRLADRIYIEKQIDPVLTQIFSSISTRSDTKKH